jgi:hypothetical protein
LNWPGETGTNEIFFGFLYGGGEEDEGEREDGGVSVGRGNAGDLHDAGGEEEEDVGGFAELLCREGEWNTLSESHLAEGGSKAREDQPTRKTGRKVTMLYFPVETEFLSNALASLPTGSFKRILLGIPSSSPLRFRFQTCQSLQSTSQSVGIHFLFFLPPPRPPADCSILSNCWRSSKL